MMKKPILISLFLLSCYGFFLSSCKHNSSINLGNNDPISVEITDSISVETGTYLLDSLPTSNLNSVLLGTVNDADFGKTTASSYLQLKPSFSTSSPIPEGASFDSLNLVLPYNGYFYGDTSSLMQLKVHRLSQEMILRPAKYGNEAEEKPVFVDGPALYSTSSFASDPLALGTKLFQPKPNSKDSIVIAMQKSLGQELFNLMVKKDRKITDLKEFLEYFKGIVIKNDQAASIIGVNADEIKMRLYYNYRNSEGFIIKRSELFTLNDKQYQFNHIESDRKQTLLSNLTYQNRLLTADQTKQQLFVQAGIGITTKLNIPGLENFLNAAPISVNRAELVIETNPQTYAIFKVPSRMMLFITNPSTVPKSILQDPFQKENQLVGFRPGNEAGSNGKYVFQLTGFLTEFKKGQHKKSSLLLSVPLTELFSTVNRLQILNKNEIKSIKLKILYTKL